MVELRAVEESVCGIFARTLAVKEVGPDDNLYDLGGHSLLAARIAVEVLQRHDVAIPLAHFLDEPTPRNLALMIVNSHA